MVSATPPQSNNVPPGVALFQLMTGHYVSQAVYVAAKLGIADLLKNGPRHYTQLAEDSGAHPSSLHRLLRLLAAAGVLSDEEGGNFGLTPVGQCLRSDVPGSMRLGALLWAGPPLTDAWRDLLHSVKTGEVGFERAFGADVFSYMSKHPDDAAVFYEGMSMGAPEISAAVVATYDFSQFKTVVDIGGAYGVFMTALLRAHPALRGVILDLPHVAERAKKEMEAAGLAERCQVIAGDFAETVPSGGDAYVLKHVIHDWDDERSIKLLKNCRRVMAPEAKLLIIQSELPAQILAGLPHLIMTGNDVNMLAVTGGRERTRAEFAALFETAGLALNQVIPTPALVSVIEAVPH
jgi:O-methyltransferase domain/Dimerisation domain